MTDFGVGPFLCDTLFGAEALSNPCECGTTEVVPFRKLSAAAFFSNL